MNHSNRQLATFYVVVYALIFNAITSSFVYAGSGSGQKSVLFCTSQGYKWVQVDSDENVSERAQQHCKLCLFPPSDEPFEYLVAGSNSAHSFDAPGVESPGVFPTSFKLRFAYLIAQGRAPPLNTLFIV